jgi:hypothetical protein
MDRRFVARMSAAWLCALLALVLPLAGVAEVVEDPVAVRVGEFCYSRSKLQKSLDSALELSEMLRGDAPSEAEKQARLQATVDSFVGLGVIENKLSEAGAALAVLWYSQSEINVALKGVDLDGLTLEEIIKQALKKMMKN